MAALPVSVFSSITEKLCCLIPSKSNGYRVGNNTVLKDNQVPKNFMKNETEKKKSEKKNHPQISTPVDEKASCCSYLKTNLHPGNIQHIQHRDKSRLAMPDPFPRRKHGYL